MRTSNHNVALFLSTAITYKYFGCQRAAFYVVLKFQCLVYMLASI